MELININNLEIRELNGDELTSTYKDFENKTDYIKGAILENLFEEAKYMEMGYDKWEKYLPKELGISTRIALDLRNHFKDFERLSAEFADTLNLNLIEEALPSKEDTQAFKKIEKVSPELAEEILHSDSGLTKKEVIEIAKEDKDVILDIAEVAPEKRKTVIATLHTGDNESYTPLKYIESARLVMGGINLDPASNDYAQSKINADEYFTKENDGLDKDWKGNIWLNPPYAHPLIRDFIDKLVAEHKNGNCKQAVLLTNNSADTNWFHIAAKESSAICFTKGRINFYKADDSTTSPTNGQTFFYFGEDNIRFAEEFKQYGMIVEVIENAS